MIAPNDSFVVRFTPPRAGTYMYHVHGERGEELAAGLYAPLLVLEPGAPYDPRTDRTFVLADGGPVGGRPIFVNGSATPDTVSAPGRPASVARPSDAATGQPAPSARTNAHVAPGRRAPGSTNAPRTGRARAPSGSRSTPPGDGTSRRARPP
jgi:FtsP/CotA-like multicopper oxidase with cupredoxin domain